MQSLHERRAFIPKFFGKFFTGLNASEGDEVIVFGGSYPITEVAKDLDTIPYEVLTNVSRRVKRVYYQE